MTSFISAKYDSTGNQSLDPNILGTPVAATVNSATGGVSLSASTLPVGRFNTIRTAIEAASRTNALIVPPISPAPTWAASTTYAGGMTVRGVAAGSTFNLYMCAGTTSSAGASGGVSAVSGGPSGTGSALITDNTCVWQYIGRATSSGTKLLYSTVTPTTSSDVMDGYIAYVNSNNLAAMGLTPITLTSATPLVSLTNCNLTSPIVALAKNGGTVASPARNSSGIKYAARFVTSAKKWLALVAQNAIYQYANPIKAIKINGVFLSESVALGYTAAIINPGSVLLDLSTFPAGNKTIEIFGTDSLIGGIYQIAVGVDEFVYPLQAPNDFKVAIEGDSIGDMTYLSAYDFVARIENSLGELLGCQNILNNCIGGTGFISDNGGAKNTYIQRLPDITLFAPDLLIINGAHNDDSYTTAQRLAAFTAYLTAVRTAMPRCTIGIVGGNLLQGEFATQLVAENDLLAAFTAFSATDKNCFFIPVLSATPALLTSANGYMFQNGGVPAPYVNGHPVSWYYYHMNRVIADGARQFYRYR